VRPGIRWPVSCDRPKSGENATCVPGPGRCELPDGRRRSNSELGCGARSRGVRGSLADRNRGEEKIFCCVTTRGRNFGVRNGLGRDFGSLPALLLGQGMLHFDAIIPTTFSLAASCLPAMELSLTFRVLAVPLVPAPRHILAPTPFAQADPQTGSAHSGQTTDFLRNVKGAHGSGNSQGKSSGRMCLHSPRALSKLEQDAYLPVYRHLENKTER
jgi:hypothetical protein